MFGQCSKVHGGRVDSFKEQHLHVFPSPAFLVQRSNKKGLRLFCHGEELCDETIS